MTEKRETGWVIERDINSRLRYWTGRPLKPYEGLPWSAENRDAMRFARRTDAEAMLTWHCSGIGRVVEHSWTAVPPAEGAGQ